MLPPLLSRLYYQFALIACVVISVYGCGDSGKIDINAADSGNGMSASPGDSGPPGATGTTGDMVPTGDPEAVVINEIFPEASQIELLNLGSEPADISEFWLCHTTPGLIYAEMPDNTIIEPGEFLIVNWGNRRNKFRE